MKKIRLELDRLRVESFATDAAQLPRAGTVHAHSGSNVPCCGTVAGLESCAAGCTHGDICSNPCTYDIC